MTLARAARWSLIVAPVVAGIALLIFGTAGGISTGFGITLIGIGPIVWMWNWFLRMAFDEEAGKQAASERERARSSARESPPPGEPPTAVGRPPHAPEPHEHPDPRAPHQHPRQTRRRPRRRPQ